MFVWIADAVLDFHYFYEGTFWDLLIFDIPPHELYIRSLILLIFTVFGTITAFAMAKRNLSEQTLRQSEEQYRGVVEDTMALICCFLPGGEITFVNKRYCEYFARTSEELIGSTFLSLIPEADRKTVISNIAELTVDSPTQSQVHRVLVPDGGIRWQRWTNRALFDSDGKPASYQSIGEDITEHRQVEEALKETELRFRSAIDQAGDAFFIHTTEGQIVDVNKKACQSLGYQKEELLSKTIADIDPQAIEEGKDVHWVGVVESGESTVFESYHRRKTGDIFPVEITLGAISLPTETLILAIVRDITNRKRAEEDFKESQRTLLTLMSNLPGMVYRCRNDSDWTMEFVSDGCYPLTGHQPEALIENARISYGKIIHPEDRPVVAEGVQNALRNRHPFQLTYRIVTFNSEEKWVWEQGQGIFEPEGDVIALEGFITDITERKLAEEDREKLSDQLYQSQKMESVGRLAGGVAHDYNNALSVITGFAELALDDADPTMPVRSHLHEIIAAAKRATDITRQLLAFARKQTIAPKVLDLNENVEGMLKMLRPLIGEDIDIAWLPRAGLWPVKMDPSQIDQIMANLCVNARDAINGVGKITIETGNTTFDEAYCADHADFVPGDFVLLSVSDNGCGMSKETLENIFEPFFTTKDVEKGTGLGLATVYGIVKQNNGFLNVYSELDRGTTFKIYLSRHDGELFQPQGDSPVAIPRSAGETVLLVEDDRLLLELAHKILHGLGYIVLTADTPHKAIKIAKEHIDEIHLLLTDVIMPKMNGLELAHKLQALYPDIKLLFMSGYTANVIAHHGVLDDGVQFIQKPFYRMDLARSVRKALDE